MRDAPATPAVANLAREMAAWSSVDLRVRREFPPTPDGRAIVDRLRLIEDPGRVRLESRVQPSEHPQAVFVQVEARDGAAAWTTLQVQEFDRASRPVLRDEVRRDQEPGEGPIRPEPLRHWYFGDVPLPKALADAPPIGERTILGRTADGFHLVARRDSSHPQMIYWLDRETGIPLRSEAHVHWPPAPDDPPSHAWEATAFDRMGGRWLPTRSELRTFRAGVDDAAGVALVHTTIVESVALGEHHADSLFRVDPAADVYRAGVAQDPTIVPLRASYPEPSSSLPTAAIGLGLIAVALFLAFVFWRLQWRGRRWVRSPGKAMGGGASDLA